MATYIIRIARRAGIVILFTMAAVLGLASGVFFAYAGDLPRISALDDYAPSTISRVYGAHGEIVGEFAIQRREVIPYEAISPLLKQAILAAEDATFEQHFGLSIPRIVVTLMKDVIERRKAGGASTLTQQLTRKLFLTDEKTWERKIKEAILAIQIEKRYTKNEIFTLYCNQMYFGHGVYGVQAASRLYFGKTAKDLTLEEAALIAGILQGNVRQSPYVNMDAAVRRRNYALTRMAGDRLHLARRSGGSPQEADRHQGGACFAGVGCTLLPRRRPQGARSPLRRQAALRERPLNPDRTRRTAPGSRKPRHERGAAANRQAAGLPEAAQHRFRRPCRRDVQARSLGAADARRRRRAGGGPLGRRRHHRSAGGEPPHRDRSQGVRLGRQAGQPAGDRRRPDRSPPGRD